MLDRFERAYAPLKLHEGGYVNHPKDPGGATNMGVTQRTYDAWRKANGSATRSVRDITPDEAKRIYREQYWNSIRADELPHGVAYVVFDAAVNSGPSRAAKWLQKIVGENPDGLVGVQTIRATLDYPDKKELINRYCDMRLAFMKRLKHWPTFKNGWTTRVAQVRTAGQTWLTNGSLDNSAVSQIEIAQAIGEYRTTSVLSRAAKSPKVAAAGAAFLASNGTSFLSDGPISYALSVLLVLGGIGILYLLMKDRLNFGEEF